MSTSHERWSMWDIFLRCGTAEIHDAEIPGVENIPDFPQTELGGGRLLIGRLVRLRATNESLGLSPADVIAAEVSSGDIVAVASEGKNIAIMGGRLASRVIASGGSGVVTDGLLRDRAELSRLPISVWARGTTPAAGGLPGTYARVTEPSVQFGVEWHEGDWYAQDSDGALQLSPPAVDAILKRFGRGFDR